MSSIWESLYGPGGQFSGSQSGLLGSSAPATAPTPKAKPSALQVGLLVGGIIVAIAIFGILLYEYKKWKANKLFPVPLNPPATQGASLALAQKGTAAVGSSAYWPPNAPAVSSITVPGIPQEDPGRPGSDAAWWHDVERWDQISQTAMSPYSGWWPASPTIEGRKRGDYYRGGYGSFESGPYNSGYLVYPQNFIPLSTTQISVTDLHPFCSKQR